MADANLDAVNLKAVDFNGLINEDVMQKIWDISKIPLPLTDRIASGTAKNPRKEWTTDKLQAPDLTNAKVDGIDTIGDNDTQVGTRLSNFCQISTKTVQVSTRARNTDNIGRSDELAYQVMMRQQELRRDVEATMLTNQASQEGDGIDANAATTGPGKSAGLGAWLVSPTAFRGATGADGGFSSGVVAAPTSGTTRALTETLVRDCAEAIYTEGGDPSILMSIPTAIRKLSEYMFTSSARIATLQKNAQGESSATALGSVNVFVTDFDVSLQMIPNRIMQPEVATGGSEDCDVFLIDPNYLEIAYLHGYRTEPLSKTGLSDKRQMAVDWTLCVKNLDAHGVIADIDYTLAVTA